MAKFTIEEVLKATEAKLTYQVKERVFTGISTDTRKIKPGDLFVALAGKNFDGHDFTAQACENGAAGVLVGSEDVKVSQDTAVIVAKNGHTLEALQRLAEFHRLRFDIPVVGITGSNGKTTTKDMAAAVLSSRFNVLKTESNNNNEIGLPLTLLELTEQHEAAVVEMAMRARGEIRELAGIARPTAAVVTNVSQTHVELLGSVENIAAAKAELVEAIGENGLVILNGDNKYVRAMNAKTKARSIFYGLDAENFIRAESIVSDIDKLQTTFLCHGAQNSFSVTIPTIGVHNVYNALAAVAVGLELGLSPAEIREGLLNFKPAAMRQSITKKGQYTIINDTYNASPTSTAAAVETLTEVAKGRKIAVLGDMLELGEEAVPAHENIGVLLSEKGIDALITIGDMARYIAGKAREGGVPYVAVCTSHHHAKQELTSFLKPGDTILFKASRGIEMEKVLELLDFSQL